MNEIIIMKKRILNIITFFHLYENDTTNILSWEKTYECI